MDSLKRVKNLDLTNPSRILNLKILGFKITSKPIEFSKSIRHTSIFINLELMYERLRFVWKHTSLFRPQILNYGLIAFTLTYLSVEQE